MFYQIHQLGVSEIVLDVAHISMTAGAYSLALYNMCLLELNLKAINDDEYVRILIEWDSPERVTTLLD